MSTITLTNSETVQDTTKTPSTIVRMTLKRDEHWKAHDDNIIGSTKYLRSGVVFATGHVFRDQTDPQAIVEYTVERELSETSGSEGVAVIARDSIKNSRMFLKVRKTFRNESLAQTMKRANHEFNMSRLLRRIIADPEKSNRRTMCDDEAVCASSIFADPYSGFIVTVFPYKQNYTDLFTFLTDHFYASWNSKQNDEEADTQRKMYYLEILNLCKWLFTIIHRLNSLGVYHADIKPENILVRWTKSDDMPVPQIVSMRLIDFGMACTPEFHPILQSMLDAQIRSGRIDQNFIASLDCYSTYDQGIRKYFYASGLEHRDPDAGDADGPTPPTRRKYLFTKEQVRTAFPRFEAWSCAIVGRELASGETEADVRMPEGLGEIFDALQSADGPRDLAQAAVHCGALMRVIEEEFDTEYTDSTSEAED